LEWLLHQESKTVNGFVGHYWNGITTQQFGELCRRIMEDPEKFPRRGVYHVFSTAVSKYEMLLAFQRKYKLPCRIEPAQNGHLNRTLATTKELNAMLHIPSFENMVEALRP
jgi:dTDP-4-dehydrorhamnose reductase